MSEMIGEHHVQCLCTLKGHTLLCVLSTMLEVKYTVFDNILLAGNAPVIVSVSSRHACFFYTSFNVEDN